MTKTLPEEWTPEQVDMFIRMYDFMVMNFPLFTHPQTPPIDGIYWETISHNAAWTAAEFLMEEAITIVDDVTNEVVGGTTPTVVQ